MPIEFELADEMPEVRRGFSAELIDQSNKPSTLLQLLLDNVGGKPTRIKGVPVGTVRSSFKEHKNRDSRLSKFLNKRKLVARISCPQKLPDGKANAAKWVYVLLERIVPKQGKGTPATE